MTESDMPWIRQYFMNSWTSLSMPRSESLLDMALVRVSFRMALTGGGAGLGRCAATSTVTAATSAAAIAMGAYFLRKII